MEDITSGLSELEINETEKRFDEFFENVFSLNIPGYVKGGREPVVINYDIVDAEAEIRVRDQYEAKVPEADLETVQLRYIPDYLRELKTKEEYWKKEFKYWGDLISKKNWKLYEKKVKDEIIRNKTILKNLGKGLAIFRPAEEKHILESLDPERVQRLVDYIKERESENMRFPVWYRAPMLKGDFMKSCYIRYAVFARYGDFRARPSRLNLMRAAEENEKKSLQN